MEIKPVLVDSKNILIIDTTGPHYPIAERYINSFLLTIRSSRLSTPIEVDILSYLYSHQIENEVFRITSAVLGLSDGENIPDAVYELEFNINNTTIEVENIGVTTEIDSKMIELSNRIDLDVTNEDIITRERSNEALQFNYLVAQYNRLLINIVTIEDQVTVNDLLDKFDRLLILWD